jgi:CheY-like chemotaxis protein
MDAEFASSAPSTSRATAILLVDDSPVERMALAHFLRRAGYHVDEVGDGQSAIEHLKNREINLLLLDLQMPDVDGFDVLNYLYKHRRGLPVILLSGMPVDLIQLKMHGLSQKELPPLFLKPVDLDQLLTVLQLRLDGEIPAINPGESSEDHPEAI